MHINEDLIKECKNFNPLAQKVLYQKYGTLLLGLCVRYANNYSHADDIFQEGFIKILTKIESFNWQGEGSLEAWMKRIMVNTAITYNKKHNKRNQHELTDELLNVEQYDTEAEPIGTKVDEDENYESDSKIVEKADFSHNELLEALATLPPDFKQVFNMHIIEGIKHEDIAEKLGIKVRTSRTRLLRARKKIQKKLVELSKQKLSVKN